MTTTTITNDTLSTEVKVALYPFTYMTVRRALQYLKVLKRREANWLEDCAHDAQQGYRPHYCVHGTNQWTDYDNICGPCEEGLSVYEEALILARADVYSTGRRFLALKAMNEVLGVPWQTRDELPREVRDAIVDWALAPTTKELGS